MIDWYFAQKFRGNQHGECNYDIRFFMRDRVRERSHFETCRRKQKV
jgi:hypothetical protein